MKGKKKAPHMGRMVRKVAAEKGLNATTLAPLLKQSPGSISKVFKRPFLHSTLLMRLERVLEYDFFIHLCTCPKDLPEPDTEKDKRIAELEKENKQLIKQNEMMEKVIDLLGKEK